MVSNVLSIAASGLAAAQAQLAATADNIANADTAGYAARRVDLVELSGGVGVGVSGETRGGEVDLAKESVNLATERVLYRANAAVVRAGDRMMGTLLDMMDDERGKDRQGA
jgi:flagellar hook protein FlgE